MRSHRNRRLASDDEGVANLITFAIGLVVFLGTVAFVLLQARLMVPEASRFAGDPDGHLRATAVLETMLSTGTQDPNPPGGDPGWSEDGAIWTSAATPTDARPGWGAQPDPDMLLDMMQARASVDGTNEHLDYQELRQALALDPSAVGSPSRLDASEVHIRIQPRFASLEVDPTPALGLKVWYLTSSTPALAAEEKAALDALLLNPSADAPTDLAGGVEPALCPTAADSPDVIVVGTGATLAADAWAFTQADVENWVTVCAGTLIVLGGDGCGCLPTTMAVPDPAGGPAHPVDPADPILQVPNALGITRYTAQGSSFVLPNPDAYTVAATSDGIPMLWKSRGGAYGLGQVLLLQTTPTQPYGSAGTLLEEGQRVLHNLLVQHYGLLFLDYGPPVPDVQLARPALATANLDFAGYAGATPSPTMVIDVAVWVFPET
jgi:hypothetical protein